MPVEVLDHCPTCGSKRIRKGSKDKALIAWGKNKNGIILEYTTGGMLEHHIYDVSDWADDIFPNVKKLPNEKLTIWEGSIILKEDGEKSYKGKLRKLSEEEWSILKQGLHLWQ